MSDATEKTLRDAWDALDAATIAALAAAASSSFTPTMFSLAVNPARRELSAAIRADERTVLAAKMPPMTTYSDSRFASYEEVEACVRVVVADDGYPNAMHLAAVLRELDATRAALATTRDCYSVDEAEQERLRALLADERAAHLVTKTELEECRMARHFDERRYDDPDA